VLDSLPTAHLITMLTSVAPAEAAGLLQALTVDRTAVLMTTMEPARLVPILLAAAPGQADNLLLTMPVEARTSFLRQLPMAQVSALLPVLGPLAAEAARAFPPRAVAEIVSDLPAPAQRRLREELTRDNPVEFGSAIYQRDATTMLVGVATTVSWLDQLAGDLLAEVLGKPLQVAVRYRQEPLQDIDIDECADRGRWEAIAGMVLLTNENVAASAGRRASAISREGRPFEAVRWIDESDSGTLKRALVRLIS
jgi:hypothetical protein